MSNCIRSVWKVHISYAHSSLCSNQICAEEKAMFLNFHSSRNLKQCTSHEISLTGVARRCQSLRNLKHTSKKQDLYLFVGLWNACFTKIQVITSKILRCYSENIQQFQYSIHKIQPTKFENKKKKNQWKTNSSSERLGLTAQASPQLSCKKMNKTSKATAQDTASPLPSTTHGCPPSSYQLISQSLRYHSGEMPSRVTPSFSQPQRTQGSFYVQHHPQFVQTHSLEVLLPWQCKWT